MLLLWLHGFDDAGPNDVFLRLHGDEGPFFKKRNLLVLSLSFPHNHGDAFLHLQQYGHATLLCQMEGVQICSTTR